MRNLIFITHESALELHRYAMLLGRDLPATDITRAPRRSPRKADLLELEVQLEMELGGLRLSHPIHIGVASASKRKHSGFLLHETSTWFPRHSVCSLTDGIVVASPALALVQFACRKSVAQTALLALEYCGTYSSKLGLPVRYGIKPTLSSEDLRRSLARFSGLRGLNPARRALGYVRDNSASPRESQFLLALCLPTTLGGSGVRLPKMNYEIECSEQAWRISGRRMLRCDLCWPEARLDVEYQSREFHEGVDSRVRDSRRANALQAMGYTVVHVTDSELNTIADFNVIAGNIKKHLGMRNRIRVGGYEEAQIALRRDLGLPVAYG